MKWIGALFVIAACGGFGFHMAAAHRADIHSLRSLISILDFMECELNYRLTPLPSLCRQAAAEHRKPLSDVFLELAKELDSQISPDVSQCMRAAIRHIGYLPQTVEGCLLELGNSLGNYNLEGQLLGLKSVRTLCRRKFEELDNNKDVRLRSYQALSLCAGAALAILLI